jgi:hypothetical protein
MMIDRRKFQQFVTPRTNTMKTKTPARNKDIKAQRRNRELQALRELEERVEQLVLTFKPTKLIAGCEE